MSQLVVEAIHTIEDAKNSDSQSQFDSSQGDSSDIKDDQAKTERYGETSAIEDNPNGDDAVKKKIARKRRKLRASTICTTNCRYELVRQTAEKFHMKEKHENWNVYWTDLSISIDRCKEMKRFQRINHFPGMLEICRKDLLARNLNRMLKVFPQYYAFFPRTWCLPTDIMEVNEYAKNNRQKTFIVKPDLGCQGKGIFITKNLKELRLYERVICQVYISRPFLIDGFKFDLRIYTLITSCDPLRIYVYNEGLARFATKRYKDPNYSNLTNMYMHLTNYSVNKHSRSFVVDDIEGSKRRISTINQWLLRNAYDVDKIWAGIDDVIVKTILVCLPTLKHCYHTCFPNHYVSTACFEILGFDFMLDWKMKPYLLEVNHSPSFHTDTPIDTEIKEALLYDTFNILNLAQNDKIKIMLEDRKRIRDRLFYSTNTNLSSILTREKEQAESLLKAQIDWENKHTGNYRKVYPCADMGKYDKFMTPVQSSLYSDTLASKAKENTTKVHGEQPTAPPSTPKPKVKTSSGQKTVKNDKHREKSPPKATKNEFKKNSSLGGEPSIIDEVDEKERLSAMAKREFLIQSHGLLEKIYEGLKKAGQLRIEDEIKCGRSSQWDVSDRAGEVYDRHKKQFTQSINNVLQFISKRKELQEKDESQEQVVFSESRDPLVPCVKLTAATGGPDRSHQMGVQETISENGLRKDVQRKLQYYSTYLP